MENIFCQLINPLENGFLNESVDTALSTLLQKCVILLTAIRKDLFSNPARVTNRSDLESPPNPYWIPLCFINNNKPPPPQALAQRGTIGSFSAAEGWGWASRCAASSTEQRHRRARGLLQHMDAWAWLQLAGPRTGHPGSGRMGKVRY